MIVPLPRMWLNQAVGGAGRAWSRGWGHHPDWIPFPRLLK
jgi:hypothetical protein